MTLAISVLDNLSVFLQSVVVMQYDHELKGDEQVYCYLYDYEPGMFGTHEDAESIVNGDEVKTVRYKIDITSDSRPVSFRFQ